MMMSRKRSLGSDALVRNYSITFMAIQIKIHGTMFVCSLCSNVNHRADLCDFDSCSLSDLSDLSKSISIL